jgi:hypothetical protein
MIILIENGPHAGLLEWNRTPPTLRLRHPSSTSSPLEYRPDEHIEYRRQPAQRPDAVAGIDARYRWVQ